MSPSLSADHGQKRELGGVTITRGDLTSPGPLQKGVYSLTRRYRVWARSGNLLLDQSTTGFDPNRSSAGHCTTQFLFNDVVRSIPKGKK